MSPRRRSALSRFEKGAYLASRTAGDLRAAGRGPGALAGRVARRQVRRAAFSGGAPVYLRRRRTSAKPAPAGPPPEMSALDALAVLLALLILGGGTITCAITGAWAGMIFILPIGLGLVLFAGRGGRDGLSK